MASKQIVNRQKSSEAVGAIGESQAESAGAAIGELCKRHLKKGEALPDFSMVMKLCVRVLEGSTGAMVEADAANEAELSDDEEVRTARDEASQALYDKIVELREMLTGAYGAATANKVIVGSTPQDPVMLARFAGEVETALEKVKLPAPRIKGAKLDASEAAESLRESRAALSKHIKAVAREVREGQATLDAKNRVTAAYDEIFAGVATLLTGQLRLAGKTDLAARVRPSSRRPGQTASDAEDEPSASPPET